jgi:hypothetical protein
MVPTRFIRGETRTGAIPKMYFYLEARKFGNDFLQRCLESRNRSSLRMIDRSRLSDTYKQVEKDQYWS